MIIDISQPLRPGIAGFPIDTAYEESFVARIGPGCPVNVARIVMSTHGGTHADSPYHYDAAGKRIGELDLDIFMGPCRVIDARDESRIAASLNGTPPRVLLRLMDKHDPNIWNPDFRALAAGTVKLLAAHHVKLVGVDGPSVDPSASKVLPAHGAARDAGMLILENLVLSHVEPGDYELIALPLRFENLDASPVRAVLRPLRP
jgi:arylformamidase